MSGSAECRSSWTRRCLVGVVIAVWLVVASGCGGQFPGAPVAQPVAQQEAEPGCRVHGRIVSTGWRDLGGDIERAIVAVWTIPGRERIKEVYGDGGSFEVRLPPGKYRLDCGANGTRGATFESLTREIAVAQDQAEIDLGKIDLPISKSTALYDKPAPELTGIVAWQDSPPLNLKALRGRVVVLDFFGHYCTICHEYKPDLIKLRDKFEREGLVVVAIHDSSVATLDEMNFKMGPVLQRIYAGHRHLPIALDGSGEQSVFEAYGIYAVPAVILIDQEGRIVRRYHHAGKPELEADVQSLVAPISDSIQ